MQNKVRAACHNGRATKSGRAYNPDHNSRTNGSQEAEHVNKELTPQNRLWTCEHGELPPGARVSFGEVERRYYEARFNSYIKRKNEKAEQHRQPERKTSAKQYRSDVKHCPMETLLTAGEQISPDTLWEMALEYQRAMQALFPLFKPLDMALHVDELGMPHVHARGVFEALDRNGNVVASESKSLAQMGVEAPNPAHKPSKFNSPKMTFTEAQRGVWVDICKEHGLAVVLEPLEKSKTGLELEAYKASKELETVNEDLDKAKAQLNAFQEVFGSIEQPKPLKDRLRRQNVDCVYVKAEDFQALQDAYKGLPEALKRLQDGIAAVEQGKAALSKREASIEALRGDYERLKRFEAFASGSPLFQAFIEQEATNHSLDSNWSPRQEERTKHQQHSRPEKEASR